MGVIWVRGAKIHPKTDLGGSTNLCQEPGEAAPLGTSWGATWRYPVPCLKVPCDASRGIRWVHLSWTPLVSFRGVLGPSEPNDLYPTPSLPKIWYLKQSWFLEDPFTWYKMTRWKWEMRGLWTKTIYWKRRHCVCPPLPSPLRLHVSKYTDFKFWHCSAALYSATQWRALC